jgi:DNA-binding transcriptional LysR family regulator
MQQSHLIDKYPDIQIDLAVGNQLIDVIDGGFDAGIRHRGTVPQDMVAQRLSADIGCVVADAPAYLDRFGTPANKTPAGPPRPSRRAVPLRAAPNASLRQKRNRWLMRWPRRYVSRLPSRELRTTLK